LGGHEVLDPAALVDGAVADEVAAGTVERAVVDAAVCQPSERCPRWTSTACESRCLNTCQVGDFRFMRPTGGAGKDGGTGCHRIANLRCGHLALAMAACFLLFSWPTAGCPGVTKRRVAVRN